MAYGGTCDKSLAIPGFYLGIFVQGGSSDEGIDGGGGGGGKVYKLT